MKKPHCVRWCGCCRRIIRDANLGLISQTVEVDPNPAGLSSTARLHNDYITVVIDFATSRIEDWRKQLGAMMTNQMQCSEARADLISTMVDRAGWLFGLSLLAVLASRLSDGAFGAVAGLAAFGCYLGFVLSTCAAAKAANPSRSVPWLALYMMIPLIGWIGGIFELVAAKKFANTATQQATA